MSDTSDQVLDAVEIRTIASEVFATLGSGGNIPPFSARPGGLTVADAYRITPLIQQMFEARGAKVLGRKIGFTNRTIWPQYGVYAPIWGYVFDSTVYELAKVDELPLAALSEPRVEPEIMFGLKSVPAPDMDEAALLECIEWVALGFEIVQSIYPAWKFSAADTIAANGLHGALLIGPRHAVAPNATKWQQTLPTFAIDLQCNGKTVDRGTGANVLDGPLLALRYLAGLLAQDSINPPLAAGEIISTGTLTKAMPVAAGESWSSATIDIALDAIQLLFC
jgi:2-keto-4-pentenoate hydratase